MERIKLFFQKISLMYLVKSDPFHIDNVSKYSKNFEKQKFWIWKVYPFSATTAAMPIAREGPNKIRSSQGYHTTTPIQNYYLLIVGELKTKV